MDASLIFTHVQSKYCVKPTLGALVLYFEVDADNDGKVSYDEFLDMWDIDKARPSLYPPGHPTTFKLIQKIRIDVLKARDNFVGYIPTGSMGHHPRRTVVQMRFARLLPKERPCII